MKNVWRTWKLWPEDTCQNMILKNIQIQKIERKNLTHKLSKPDIEKKTRRQFAFPRSENFKDSLWGREWRRRIGNLDRIHKKGSFFSGKRSLHGKHTQYAPITILWFLFPGRNDFFHKHLTSYPRIPELDGKDSFPWEKIALGVGFQVFKDFHTI